MGLVAAVNMFVILKLNRAAYGCKLQSLPTTMQVVFSLHDIVYVFSGVNRHVQMSKLLSSHI
jgi:hypothetical protein